LKNILMNNFDVFSKHSMDLGKVENIKHQIKTLSSTPIFQPLRKVPIKMEERIDKLIDELKDNEIIRDSSSPWSSPIVAIEKPNGQVRMCIDYRKLNTVIEKPIFPIPDASQLFDALSESKYFSTLDLSQGYYQKRYS